MTPEQIFADIQKIPVSEGNPEAFINQRALRLVAVCVSILTNEALCDQYLKELDERVTEHLQVPPSLTSPPTEYAKYRNGLVPRPPMSEQAADQACHDALEAALLSFEKACGVNLQGVPELAGHVPNVIADKIVKADHLWNDLIENYPSFTHGCLSHRLQHYIIRRAIDDNAIDLSVLKDYLDLSRKGLILKHLVLSDLLWPSREKERIDSNGTVKQTFLSPWIIAIDNNHFKGSAKHFSFFNKTLAVNLTDPSIITAFLQSRKSFEQYPYLAHAIYRNQYRPLLDVAQRIPLSANQVLEIFIAQSKQDTPIPNYLEICVALHLSVQQSVHTGKTKVCDNAAAIFNKPSLKHLDILKGKNEFAEAVELANKTKNIDEVMSHLNSAIEVFDALNSHADAVTANYTKGLLLSKTDKPAARGFFRLASERGKSHCPEHSLIKIAEEMVEALTPGKPFAFKFS